MIRFHEFFVIAMAIIVGFAYGFAANAQTNAIEVQPQTSNERSQSSVKFKSLMFDQTAISQFNQVYDAYMLKKRNASLANSSGGSGDLDFLSDLLGELEEGAQQIQEVNLDTSDKHYPVIHLSSIIFESDDQWSSWINGKRVTNANNGKVFKTIKVKDINKEKAVIHWKPWNASFLSDHWRKTVKGKRPHNVKFNQKSGLFVITLKQNQSFVTTDMKITDGISFGRMVQSTAPDPVNAVARTVNRAVNAFRPQDQSIEEMIAGSGLSPRNRAIQSLGLE